VPRVRFQILENLDVNCIVRMDFKVGCAKSPTERDK